MDKFSVMENWLSTVAYSHSNSKQTRAAYTTQFQKFLDFVEKTPEQVVKEYERSSDRKFKRVYATYLMALIRELQALKYAPSSVNSVINVVRSFFKYNDLPLGFIPSGSNLIEFHNRDIDKNEVLEVLRLANIRDRAFFCILTQSGLRPSTIAKLKIKDMEKILAQDTPIPCKINVRQENTKGKYSEYFSFIGEESVTYLKDYLKTKGKVLTEEDYVFSKFGKEQEKPLDAGILTHMFERIVKRLRDGKVLDFKTSRKEMDVKTKTKEHLRDHISRSDIRLYNLRKYFRKYAGQAGPDYVQYWMGHTSSLGVDLHYFSKDVELHRKIYREKAMPHLRLETATVSESQTAINELTQRLIQKDSEFESMKARLAEMESTYLQLKAVLSLPNVTIQAEGVTPEQVEKLKRALRLAKEEPPREEGSQKCQK